MRHRAAATQQLPPESTWDGLPVAADEPHGAAIVVRRPEANGGWEYLLLHRFQR